MVPKEGALQIIVYSHYNTCACMFNKGTPVHELLQNVSQDLWIVSKGCMTHRNEFSFVPILFVLQV